jgi:hypothetical protein
MFRGANVIWMPSFAGDDYGLRMLATNLSISVAKVLFSILAEFSIASPMSMSSNGIGSNTNLQSL